MKKALRYVLIVIGIIAALVGGFALFVTLRGVPTYKAETINLTVAATPQRLEKGQKLAAMLCSSCHMDGATGKLTGRLMPEAPQFGAIYSKNITGDPTNGIGNWTDGQLAYLLRTGIKPDGRFLPIMAKAGHMSDEDIYSIIAYLRSGHRWVAPDGTKQPETKYSFLAKFLTTARLMKPAPYPTHAIAEPDTTNAVAWGRYIAINELECYSCHSKDFAKVDYDEPERSDGFFGGGNKMIDMDGKEIYTRNITMDKATGIGNWTEAEFIKALKYGQTPHGQALRRPMIPYTGLSDNEAKAVYAYLKTVPKISNVVAHD